MNTETRETHKTASLFSLFASSSTLICCAMPALFVALGAGASFASLVSTVPFLITLSLYKLQITSFAFVMLVIAGYTNYRTTRLPCPVDPELGRACLQTRRRSLNVYYASSGLFVFASLFTYVVPRFL